MGTNLSQRCFIGGERVLPAGHIIKCGKYDQIRDSSDTHIKAFFLQTSHLKEKPHEIKIVINSNRKILNYKCSGKAGLEEKCKHYIAVLLYYYRYVSWNLRSPTEPSTP